MLLKKPIVFIVGPTAVGKSTFALSLAKRIRGEIISCDSMQVYKGMRILSQAPAGIDRGGVRHHLIGTLDPAKEYSAALFMKEAAKAARSIIKKGKVPVAAGGSGLYVKALIDGLFPSPKRDAKFRKEMENFASRYGKNKLHERLEKIDPAAAKKIHPNDVRRVIRALEIYHSTGNTPTEIKNETRGLRDDHDIKIFGLILPREKLYARINDRVDRMFDGGLIGEVRRLSGKRLSMTAKAAIGLREVTGYLEGGLDLDSAKALMKMNTRRFAKRQLCWFRADKRIRWFDVSRVSEKEVIIKIIRHLTLNSKS